MHSNQRFQVAIKTMKKFFDSFDTCLELREVIFLRQLPMHPHLVPALDIFLDPFTKKLHIAMEYMDGNLFQMMKAREGKLLEGHVVKSVLFVPRTRCLWLKVGSDRVTVIKFLLVFNTFMPTGFSIATSSQRTFLYRLPAVLMSRASPGDTQQWSHRLQHRLSTVSRLPTLGLRGKWLLSNHTRHTFRLGGTELRRCF